MRLERSWRVLALTSACLLIAVLLTPSASAAPPRNDEVSRARAISTIPSRLTTDTREATRNPRTDGDDCIGGNTVWYKFRPRSTITARAVTAGSDFDTRLAVFTGSARALKRVACSDDALGTASAIELKFTAGKVYFFVISTCCDASASGGGRAVLHFYRPVSFTATASLTSASAGDVSGAAHLSGQVSCSNPGVISVVVIVRQRISSRVARGLGEAFLECQKKSKPWSLMIDSGSELAFRARPAHVTAFWQATDGFTTTDLRESAEVRSLELSPN
jgi:hypothetical protein